MSRPNASSAGLECYAYESMEEPDLISIPAVAAGLESFWITEPDLSPQPDLNPKSPSDSIWEWKGHTDVSPQGMNIPSMLYSEQAPLDSIGNLNAHASVLVGSSSQGITKSSTIKYYESQNPKNLSPLEIGSTVGAGFSVICHICGHKLGMPDWVCYRCGGKRAGKVIKKWCSICDRMYEHESADCPYDEAQAAKYRWIREEEKKKKYRPLEPCDIPYVPRKPTL